MISYILVKGFVKTFPQKFYYTQGSSYIIKKNNSLITKSIINIKTNNKFSQQKKQLKQELEIKLTNIQDLIENAIIEDIEDKKNEIKNLYIKSKVLYRDNDINSIRGEMGRNIISFLIKKNKMDIAMTLIKYIDQKDIFIMDLIYVFIDLLEDYEKDEKKFNKKYKISQILWSKINFYRNNLLNDELLIEMIKNFNLKIRKNQKILLIKPFLKGMISSGIKNENICLNIFKNLLILQQQDDDNYNEECLIYIYNIFKESGIKFNDKIYKDLLILQQKKNNINNLTFFYKDMISNYAKEELDQIGYTSLQLIENSFKEGKPEIAIKSYDKIPTKEIKSNPIILFELFKGLFELKIENSKIFLIFKAIRNDIKINSDIGYYLIVGFLWNDGLNYAERILHEMTELKIIPPDYTFISLMTSYWNNRMINKMEELMGLIKPIYIQEYMCFLRDILHYYNKKQDRDGILRWINELMRLSDEDNETKNYSILMHSYGVLGRLYNVIELWDELNEKYTGEKLSPAISILLDQIGICGDITTLKKYWKLISNNSNGKYILNLNHYNSYIEALCRLKAFDDAIKIFKFDVALKFEPNLKTVITLLQPLINNRHNEKDNVISFIKMRWPNLYNDLITCIINNHDRFYSSGLKPWLSSE
jgi:hypothetical protein